MRVASFAPERRGVDRTDMRDRIKEPGVLHDLGNIIGLASGILAVTLASRSGQGETPIGAILAQITGSPADITFSLALIIFLVAGAVCCRAWSVDSARIKRVRPGDLRAASEMVPIAVSPSCVMPILQSSRPCVGPTSNLNVPPCRPQTGVSVVPKTSVSIRPGGWLSCPVHPRVSASLQRLSPLQQRSGFGRAGSPAWLLSLVGVHGLDAPSAFAPLKCHHLAAGPGDGPGPHRPS